MKPAPPHLLSTCPQAVEKWFVKAARDLPWRTPQRDPYRVWLSEIMLQQTQVVTVIDYYNRFLKEFPDVFTLAKASEERVLALWSGLGYYSRGRNLHRTAQIIVSQYKGQFPTQVKELMQLPGIGSYTAGAISTFAFQERAPVVDGNIARVLSRLFNDPTPIDTPQGKKHFEALSHSLVQNATHPAHFQEGMIELGALLCKKSQPSCSLCPLSSYCLAFQKETFQQLPCKEKKLQRKELHFACALLIHKGTIFLEKTTKSLLFKGLYAPPHLEIGPTSEPFTVLQQLLKQRNLPLSSSLPPFVVKRTLTHRDLHLYGFLIESPTDLKQPHSWFAMSSLKDIGLSRAMEVLLHTAFSHRIHMT